MLRTRLCELLDIEIPIIGAPPQCFLGSPLQKRRTGDYL